MSTRLASAGPDHRFARPSERSLSASPNAWSSSAVSVCDSAAVALATTREPEPAADPGRVLLLVPLRRLERQGCCSGRWVVRWRPGLLASVSYSGGRMFSTTGLG